MSLRTGAVPAPADAVDVDIPWHFGDPHREQRELASGHGVVDLSNRGVVTVTGPDRLGWLHSLTSQHVEHLEPGTSTTALILSPHGHVEHELHLVDDGTTTWLITQPGTTEALIEYLDRMRFLLRVEVADAGEAFAVVWEPVATPDPVHPTWLVPEPFASRGYRGREVVIPRNELEARLGDGPPAGTWALEALRTAAAMPRLGCETDHRTIPHEVGWIGPAVHLQKGCYRGQETVARVQNLGRPPRRLVLLHLDGSTEASVGHCDRVFHDGREVGWIGTAARHFELGLIATAIIKRNVPADAALIVRTSSGEEIPAAQEVVVSVD